MKLRLAILGIGALVAGIILIPSVIFKKPLRGIETTISVNGARLSGTLFMAASAKPPVPVVVLLHGSGPDSRANPYYSQLAQEFAKVGCATFIYDKRGSERSTGDLFAVPFQTIINDAVAVVDHVRSLPETLDDKIIIWGGSEGGSIAPEVAVRAKAFALITQSASGVPFWQQNRHQNLLALQRAGLSSKEHDKELQAHKAAMHYARTGQGWEVFEGLRNSGISLPIRNGRDDPWWTWYRTKMDYEPTKWLEKLKVPILALWGSQDVLVPVAESKVQFEKSLSKNQSRTLLIIDSADHGMSRDGRIVHLKTMSDWLKGQLLGF